MYVGQTKPLRSDVNVTASCGKSAVAVQILDTGRKIYFDNTYRLSKVTNYMDLVVMNEAIETHFNAKNFNRQPITRLLKHRKEAPKEK